MNKTLRTLLIWALLLSPVWVGLVVVRLQPYRQGDPVMMLGQALGVAVIGIVGLILSVRVRKSDSADKLSVIGYAVPAVLVCGYQLFAALT